MVSLKYKSTKASQATHCDLTMWYQNYYRTSNEKYRNCRGFPRGTEEGK